MQAFYYYRGKLTPIPGEHPGVVSAIYKGKARVRYHEDREVLAVQARSLQIVRAAIAAYMALPNREYPERFELEWPGHYHACYSNEFRY